MTVADVHTQDITPFFNPSYDYIEEARAKNEGNDSGKKPAGIQPAAGFACSLTLLQH